MICCKFSTRIFFYQPVNTDKPNFVSFLVFVGAAASFKAKISYFETVAKREANLNPVSKQWISKDSPSYGSQSKHAKIAIHWLSEYLSKHWTSGVYVSKSEWANIQCFSIHVYTKKIYCELVYCVHLDKVTFSIRDIFMSSQSSKTKCSKASMRFWSDFTPSLPYTFCIRTKTG